MKIQFIDDEEYYDLKQWPVIGKLIRAFCRCPRRLMDTYANFVASLFSATTIGIFFSLITGNNNQSFIPILNYGWIKYLIFFVMAIVTLVLLNKLGLIIMPDDKTHYNYRLSYKTGILTSVITSFMLIYTGNIKAQLTISLISIIMFIGYFYFTIQHTKPKRKKK